MQYPEISPTAPVSRDDLAALLAWQQMQGQGVGYGGNVGQTTNQGQQSFSDMIGGQPADFMSGAPPGNSMFGTGDRAAPGFTEGGAMTTSNASMVGPLGDTTGYSNTPNPGDPALASPTFAEPEATPASLFGREGDTSDPASQAAQGRDAAALAAAAQAAQAATYSNSMPAPGAYGQPGNAMVGFNNPGGFVALGGANQPGFGVPGSPMSSTHVATPTAPVDMFESGAPNFGTPWSGALPAPSLWDPTPTFAIPEQPSEQPLATVTPEEAGVNTPGWDAEGAAINSITSQLGDYAGMGFTAGGGPVTGGGSGGGRGGAVTGGGAQFGGAQPGGGAQFGGGAQPGGWGGGGGFGGGFNATGGYEGSASMSNTGGAQGFNSSAPGFDMGGPGPGGTGGVGTGGSDNSGVGGFGGGTGGAGSAPGGGTDAGGSPGGVG